MFGGLDLKGGGSEKKHQEEASSAPAPASSSAFSFLSSSSAPANNTEDKISKPAAAETQASSSSGFSFLTSTNGDATKNEKEKEAAAPAGSAFSFLSAAPAPEETPPSASAEAPTSAASSFGFLQAEKEAAPAAVVEPVDSVPPMTAETTRTSSFGFMAGDSATVSTISRDSPSPSVEAAAAPPPADLLATSNSSNANANSSGHQPVGAGVVFGGAAAAKPHKPKKKRTRTAKIGAAAQAAASTTPPRPTSMEISHMETTTTTFGETAAQQQNTRQAAVEATRRAEEFLSTKLKESTTAAATNTTTSSSTTAATQLPPAIQSVPSEEDDIILAAKAAAEEAHKLEAAAAHNKGRGGFGGLFRSRSGRSPPATRPGIGMTTSSHSVKSHASETEASSAADRLQKEQSEAKRAMAERQLQMMQEQQQQQNSSTNKEEEDRVQQKKEEPAAKEPQNHSTKPAFVPPASPIRNFMLAPKPVAAASTTTPVAVVDVMSARAPQTPTEKFHEMLDSFQTKVVASMQEVTRLRQHRTGLLEERFVTVAKELLAAQQKKQAEIHQMAAAESEDFELADQMSDTIRNHKREQAEYAAILENISRALDELDKQKALSVQQVTKCFCDIQQKLVAFQKEQESQDTKDTTEALEKFSVVSKQLSAENDRLQQDWKHLERDAELVEQERNELEKAISEQSGEFEKLRDQAKSKLTKVEEEMEELRKQLQAKQVVAAQLRTEAAGHEDAVLRVRVKFSRQLTRLQKKEMTIKDNQEEWEMEKKSFETQREQHEAQVNQHSEALLSRDKLLDALSKEVEMADTFESIVAKEIGFDVVAVSGDEKEDGGGSHADDTVLAQMQANVVKCEAAVSESKAALKAVTTILRNLEEEVKTLEFQIPHLEEIKKAAAGRRDFKAAGKASKEIKEATARLADCKEQVANEAADRKAAAEKELQGLEIELEEARKKAHEMQRESGVTTMRRLADNIKRLVATKDSVCGTCDDKTVQGVGAFVLDAQIKALKQEGQAYGDKYGGWDELMAEIVGVTDEEEDGAPSSTVPDTKSIDSNRDQNKEADAVPETAKPVEERKDDEPENDGKSSEERMSQFRDLTKRLKDAEDELEAAVAEEDFEKAAELDETLQQLLADVQALNMTDEEMELALAEAPQPSAAVDTTDPIAADTVEGNDQVTKDEEVSGDAPPENVEQEAIPVDEVNDNGNTEDDDADGPVVENGALDKNGDVAVGGSSKDDAVAVEATEKEVPKADSTDEDEVPLTGDSNGEAEDARSTEASDK